MDMLKQQLERIRLQLAALTPSQKMLAASLVAIMVLTLAYWFRVAGNSELVSLTSKSLDASAAGEIADRIRAMGIKPTVSGTQVMVPEERKDEILAMLAMDRALPMESENDLDALFSKTGPFDGPAKTDKVWDSMRAQNMQRVLNALPNVKRANVMLDISKEHRFGVDTSPTASVAIVLRNPREKVTKQFVEGVAYFVSGGVVGMNVAKVNILIEGKPYHVNDRNGDSAFAGGDEIFDQQARWETRFAEEVSKVVANYGDGVLISVRAKLNTATQKIDAQSVEKVDQKESEINTESTETSNAVAASQEPGAVANTGISIGSGGGGGTNTSTMEKNVTKMENFPSRKTTVSVVPAGDALPVSASVSVPRSALINQLKQTLAGGATPDEATIQRYIEAQIPGIRAKVMAALNMSKPEDIFVEAYIDTPVAVGPAADTLATGGVATTITGYGKEIAVGGLAVLSLLMVSLIVKKSAPPAAPPVAIEMPNSGRLSMGERVVGEVSDSDSALDAVELGDEEVRSQHMVEQVQQMVKSNPDAAASLVKKWLSR